MPAVSEKQRRFFGAVVGAKEGNVKSPSPALQKAASSVTLDQAKDFARKKAKNKARRGLAKAIMSY